MFEVQNFCELLQLWEICSPSGHRMKSIVEKYGAGGEPVFNLEVPHVYRDLGKNFPKKLVTNVIVEKKRTGD
eukprot:SAG11_NODE_3196_length_2617_cov_17.217633_6_plen_72_part_00